MLREVVQCDPKIAVAVAVAVAVATVNQDHLVSNQIIKMIPQNRLNQMQTQTQTMEITMVLAHQIKIQR